MRIQHNIPALNTYRQMATNNTGSAKALEKLSSGYRINRAGDDAAGLAISEKMRAQINGLNRASSNAQDGVSLIQAAEGALQETHSILQRMRELSVQAANDVNETEDRKAIQDEIDQLKTEVDRIAYTTEFNKKTLLDGSLQDGLFATKLLSGRAVLAGAHIDQAVATDLVANGTQVDDIYTVAVTKQGTFTKDTFEFDLTGLKVGDTVEVRLDFDNSTRPDGNGQIMADVPVFTYTAVGDPKVDNASFIDGLRESLGEVVKDYDITNTGNSITFTAKDIGTGYTNVAITTTVAPPTPSGTAGTMAKDGMTAIGSVTGDDAEVTISKNGVAGTALTTANVDNEYTNGIFKDIETGLVFEIGDLTKLNSSIIDVRGGKSLTLQVGANTGRDQAIDINIQSLSASGLGIDNLDVSNHVAAQASVASVEKSIQTVSNQRAALGAVQNRLEHTVSNLDTVAENLQAAESRIRDVDMAKEMMNFTKFNILMQASQAMMAQANSQPQGVLQLLR